MMGEPAAEKSALRGSFDGERVLVQNDAPSLLVDLPEELVSGGGEAVDKDFGKRRAGGEKRIQKVALAQLYAQKSRDIKRFEVFMRFLEHMRSARPDSIQAMMKEAEGFFQDVTDQHLALSFLEEALGDDPGGTELSKLAGASVEYMTQTRGPEIRAGLNVTDSALETSGGGLGPPQELRDFYREVVLKYEGVKEAFDAIARNFSMKDFPGAVGYLIRAVSADLYSRGPSISPPELKRILDDLYHLESLGNLYQDCSDLLTRINDGFRMKLATSPFNLVEVILSLKDDPRLGERQVQRIVEDVGLKAIEPRIYFLRGVKELVRLLPLKLFSDQDSRNMLITAMQRALDEIIEQEE